MRPAKVELLCVGTELLRGQINTHQGYIAQRLPAYGLTLSRESSLPDDVGMIAAELRLAAGRADAVIVCGGLGPTFDDLTREAAAKAFGRRLVFKPALWKAIALRFNRHKVRAIPEENKRQAFILSGAKALKNERGSAPGQLFKAGKTTVALLPGPYSEMSPMLERDVLPALRRAHAKGLHAARLVVRTSGLPESVVDERLAPVTAEASDALEFTILSSGAQVSYHATALAKSAAAARARVDAIRARVYAAVGERVFGEGDATLESAVVARLREKKLTLAAAESCTGGLLGQRLTATAGSSDVFVGGVVAYANEVKIAQLGVPARLIEKDGAVSRACALAMAAGARERLKADVGVSITGIAGPGGGTKDKPVGLVYVAASGAWRQPEVRELRLLGGRDDVRARSASAALDLLLDFVKSARK